MEEVKRLAGERETPRVEAALLGIVRMSSSPIERRDGQPREREERTPGGKGQREDEGKWVSCRQGKVGRRLMEGAVVELEEEETTSAYSGSEVESKVELRWVSRPICSSCCVLVLHTTGCEGGGGVGSLFFCLLLHMYTAIRMRRRRTSKAPMEEPRMSPEREVEEAVMTGGGGETTSRVRFAFCL